MGATAMYHVTMRTDWSPLPGMAFHRVGIWACSCSQKGGCADGQDAQVTRRPGMAESGRWAGRTSDAKARDGRERPRLDLFCTADERMKSTDRRSTFAMHVGGHKALLHMVLSDADGPAPAG
jgi:hypothetical protein